MKMISLLKKSVLAAVLAGFCHSALAELHIIIPGGPGGGWDTTARSVGEALMKSGLESRTSFQNMSGGGGGRAIAYMIEIGNKKNDILMVNSTPIVIRALSGAIPFSHRDLTPVANLIADYGAFVELEAGVEGLVHVSEMSWTKKNVHPGKIVSTSQEVDVAILEVDQVKRRISLGLKQTLENPWQAFAFSHPAGTEVEGEVKNKTEFGLFIGLEGDVDGMVHLSDLDWNRPGEQVIEEFNKGDVVKAVVLDVDVEKERISLGIKQLGKDAVGDAAASGDLRKNAVVSCEVIGINDGGIEVKLVNHEDITSFIRRNDLARDRDDQRPERFSVGQVVDARVTNFSKKDRKVMLSIKALEIAEEKEAVAQFGSSDSGASLGDILGAALKNRSND